MLTENELIKFRRELHSYPETGWCEFVTTHKIVEKLRSFGLDPIYGRQVINPEFVAGRNPAKVEEAKKAASPSGLATKQLNNDYRHDRTLLKKIQDNLHDAIEYFNYKESLKNPEV